MADAIKLPNRDVVNININQYSAEEIAQALFDDIVAIELIALTRTDTVAGIDQKYSIISDLSKTKIQFDPSLILVSQQSSRTSSNDYPINLAFKIPDDKYYAKNVFGKPKYDLAPNIYWDGNNIIIELVNVEASELAQVQIMEDAKISIVRENDY